MQINGRRFYDPAKDETKNLNERKIYSWWRSERWKAFSCKWNYSSRMCAKRRRLFFQWKCNVFSSLLVQQRIFHKFLLQAARKIPKTLGKIHLKCNSRLKAPWNAIHRRRLLIKANEWKLNFTPSLQSLNFHQLYSDSGCFWLNFRQGLVFLSNAIKPKCFRSCKLPQKHVRKSSIQYVADSCSMNIYANADTMQTLCSIVGLRLTQRIVFGNEKLLEYSNAKD